MVVIRVKTMKIDRKNSYRKIILAATAVAALFALIVAGYFIWDSRTSEDRNIKNGVDYSPATDEDKALNDERKRTLPESTRQEESGTGTSGGSKKVVTPVISAWSQEGGTGTDLKINGYVPEIIETNGSCTVTLTKGSTTASTSKSALQNAQNTSCGQLIIPYTQLSPGLWQAVLSYSSSMSAGSSIKTEIEVR